MVEDQPAMPVSRFAHGVVWMPNICEAIHFEGAGLGGGGAENPQAPRFNGTQKDKGFL